MLYALLLLSFAAIPAVAHADNIRTFDLTGTLINGTTASGTVSIDVTTGAVGSSDITFTTTDNVTYTLNQTNLATSHVTGISFFVFTQGDLKSYIEVPLESLVDYQGGNLCTLSAICPGNNASNFFQPGLPFPPPNFVTGSLTAVTATPEPSSLFLLGTGVLGAAGMARRKLFA